MKDVPSVVKKVELIVCHLVEQMVEHWAVSKVVTTAEQTVEWKVADWAD